MQAQTKNTEGYIQTDTQLQKEDLHKSSSNATSASTKIESCKCDLEQSQAKKDRSAFTNPTTLEECKAKRTPYEESKEEEEFSLELELQRRLNPKTPEDFEQLQAELIRWKHREERKIAVMARTPADKRKMTTRLLDQETKLIRKIDMLKSLTSETWKAKRLEKVMEQMTKAKHWSGGDGKMIVADSPEVLRAKEMKDMFQQLKNNVDNAETRIKVLQQAKNLIEKTRDHSSLAKEVCSVLDREIEMLNIELGGEFLVGLRKRMLNSFAKLMTQSSSLTKTGKPKFKVNTQSM